MSTQHPDNVKQPFFVENSIVKGDDEIKEAFYAFSHLKIQEQLWDAEGKEVDNFVVEKLLSRYSDYFKKHKLGQDRFITVRGPNPRVEKNMGKMLLEILEGIPRNFDIANKFYKEDIAPIFEVAIPMVSSSNEITRVKKYYDNHVIGKSFAKVGDIKLNDWVGEFKPKQINVIPLIEDRDSMLNAHNIVSEYMGNVNVKEYQRVWLARSDPALNYGNLSAILVNRIALQRLHKLEETSSVDIYPMIGCGSAPFRGNFKPGNEKNVLNAYPSMQTFTMQSAFKYDYDESDVVKAVDFVNKTKRKNPNFVEENYALEIIKKVSDNYKEQIVEIAPLVNKMSRFIPQRRKRKLHVGLFGYSRESDGVSLPRAIKFTASLYSLGLPPEILGLNNLNEKDWDFIHQNSGVNLDLIDAMKYYNKDNLFIFSQKIQNQVKQTIKNLNFELDIDHKHKKVTGFVLKDFSSGNMEIGENIERAASIRKFLG
jgi:phosphoenolpyruvate carboxylase